MSCIKCFEDWICKCVPYGSAITMNSYLTPLTQYTYVITDKFDNKYSGTAITDAFGHIEIDTADLPEGMLNEHAGNFKLEIMDESCKPINFIMASEYSCVEFSVKGGTLNKDEIGCDIPNASIAIGGGGG